MASSPANSLDGVNVAAITPRGRDGDLNFGATFELLDYLGAARVGGVALFTEWGEYFALAIDERSRVLYLAVKRSRVPVLAGVGSATLDHSVTLAREARSAGAAAVLLPPPLFYRYDADDIREFYLQFARQLGGGIAILLAGAIDPETAGDLLATGSFAGIQTDSASLEWFERLHHEGDGVALLSGYDPLFGQARCAGLGVLSAAACAAPELAMALNHAIVEHDAPRIARLEAMHLELVEWLGRFPVPVGLKAAVSVRGVQAGASPAPLPPAKQRSLDEFREWFRDWLPATRRLAAYG